MNRLLYAVSTLALMAAPACARVDQGGERTASAAEAQLEDNQSRADTDGDGQLETLTNGYTDQHDWVDAEVYIGDERVAEIERVHFTGGEIDSVVLERGGVADLGGREIEVRLDRLDRATTPGGAQRFQLSMTKAQLEAMPTFDESTASGASLDTSDETYDADYRASSSASSASYDASSSYDAGARAYPAAASTSLADNQSREDVDADGDVETLTNGYTDQHPWVNAGVFIGDERVAEVERVHVSGDDIDGIVVETGGIADLGGREISLDLDEANMTSGENGETRFELSLTQAEFDAKPDFDEAEASNSPFSSAETLTPESLDDTDDMDGEDALDNLDADDASALEEVKADIDGDGELETLKNGYTDEHDWVAKEVFIDDARVGEIERVHYDGDAVDALIVEAGGVADIGGREVEIDLDRFTVVAGDEGAERFELAMSTSEFDALPDFDEDTASDYPLSDDN